MGEFQEKVEDFGNTLRHSGFTVPEDDSSIPMVEEQTQEGVIEEQLPEQEKKSERHHARREKLKHKLNQARYESKLKDEQNQRLLLELQEKDRLLAEKQYQVEEAVNNDHNRYFESLLLREQAVLNELKIAKEEGDIQKDIDLTKDLSKVMAEKSTYDLYKSQLHNPMGQQDPQESYYPQSYAPPMVQQNSYQDYGEHENDHYEDWLDRNEWADPRSRRYSPQLRGEAEGLSKQFSDLLISEGRQDLIGTPEYYHSLDNIMRNRDENTNEGQQPQNYEHSGTSMVAPVSRSGSTMSDYYMSSNPNSTRGGVSLTSAEYEIAKNPIQTPGRNFSKSQAIDLYKKGKEYRGGIDQAHPHRYIVPE